MTRSDRPTWVELLSADFSWFPPLVSSRTGKKYEEWKECVEDATDDELEKLWHEIEEYRMRKLYEH